MTNKTLGISVNTYLSVINLKKKHCSHTLACVVEVINYIFVIVYVEKAEASSLLVVSCLIRNVVFCIILSYKYVFALLHLTTTT